MGNPNDMVTRLAWVFFDDVDPWMSKGDCLQLARAAIGGMREPTQLMEDIGIAELDAHAGGNNVKREHLVAVWRAMIDAALKG